MPAVEAAAANVPVSPAPLPSLNRFRVLVCVLWSLTTAITGKATDASRESITAAGTATAVVAPPSTSTTPCTAESVWGCAAIAIVGCATTAPAAALAVTLTTNGVDQFAAVKAICGVPPVTEKRVSSVLAAEIARPAPARMPTLTVAVGAVES